MSVCPLSSPTGAWSVMGGYENASGRAENCAAELDEIEMGSNDKENKLSRRKRDFLCSNRSKD